MARKGKLIVFEGPEGGGKTTQATLAKDFLEEQGFEVLLLREPGGTPFGEEIREILLYRDFDLNPLSQMLFFYAARSEILEKEVRPALAKGIIVIMDRYYLSTFAYQIMGLQAYELREVYGVLNRHVVRETKPDFVFLLDPSDLAEGLRRAQDGKEELDTYEAKDLDFHQRVCDGFYQVLSQEDVKHLIINTSKSSKEETHQKVKTVLAERLGINL